MKDNDVQSHQTMIGFISFILLGYFFFNIADDFILVNVTSRESFLPTCFESDGPSSKWAKVRKLVCSYVYSPTATWRSGGGGEPRRCDGER